MPTLRERIAAVREKAGALVTQREAFCSSCTFVERRDDGSLHCPKCGCSAPQGKARCPEGLWGDAGAPGCPVPYGADCPRFELKSTEAICFGCKHPDPVKRAEFIQSQRARTVHRPSAKPTVSIVIPSLNGHVRKQLPQTLANLRATGEADEIIVGDDCSDPPLEDVRFRNPVRLGISRTRHIGCTLASGDVIGIVDDHTRVKTGDISFAAKIAWETRGFVYGSPKDYPGVDLRLKNGIWRCKWGSKYPGVTHIRTTGIMGGFYFMRRDVLESVGGWPALPGFAVWDEEFWALYCRAVGIPIYFLPTIGHYHEWNTDQLGNASADFPLKPFETPEEHIWLNLAAVYRLLCDDGRWAEWRKFFADGFIFNGNEIRMRVPEPLLADAETPEMRAYGETIRSTYPPGVKGVPRDG